MRMKHPPVLADVLLLYRMHSESPKCLNDPKINCILLAAVLSTDSGIVLAECMSMSGGGHVFVKEAAGTTCAFCNNVWSSKDKITSKYQICSLCGANVHTNCRSLAMTCIPCDASGAVKRSLPPGGLSGSLYIKVTHVYDVTVVPGTLMYGQVRLAHNSQTLRTLTTESGNNDCVWESQPDVAAQHVALKFLVQINSSSVEEVRREAKVDVEIWSSFLGFFDTCLAATELDVSPVFLYPNIKMERWFPLTNRVNGEADIREGKLLLNMMFEPANGVSAEITRSIRANSVAAGSSSSKSHSEGASTKELRASVGSEEPVQSMSFNDVPGPSQQLSTAFSSSVDHGDTAGTVRSRRSSTSSSRRPSDSASASSEARVPVPSAEVQPAALAVALGAAALTEPPISAAIAPSTDFYQSIAEFTELTTNTIGNFFYEIEALNLSSTAKDAINGDWHDTTGSSSVPVSAPGKSESTKTPAVDNAPALGVGYMHIHVVSAFKSKVRDVSDGDHYVLACVEDSKREFKSKSVLGSATPIFNVRWTIKMEHYRAAVNLYLMDAHTHRRIASCRFSCFSLMQRDADSQSRHWKDTPLEKVPLRNVSDNEEMGYLNAQVSFEEDLQGLFLSEDLHDAPSSPPELLSVQRLGTHIARFTAIIDLFNQWYAEYLYIMEWKDPMSTAVMFLVFLYFTLKVQAEYALSGVMFVVVVLMTRSYLRRRNGQYIKHYVELGVRATPKFEYKPIARLRLTVLGFRQAESESAASQPHFSRPTMKLSYLPMPEVDASTKAVSESSDAFTIGYFGNSLSGVGFSIPEASQGVSQLMSNMVGSEAVAKDSIIHSVYDPWPEDSIISAREESRPYVKSETPDLSLVYPVLQPLTAKVTVGGAVSKAKPVEGQGGRERSRSSPTLLDASQHSTSSEKVSASTKASTAPQAAPSSTTAMYLPWEHNESTVKISFIDDQHSSFGGPNEEFVALPLKDIVQSCQGVRKGDTITYEIKKWYGVTKPARVLAKADSRGDLDLFAYDSASSIYLSATDRDTGNLAADAGPRRQTAIVPVGAQVCVRAQLEVPRSSVVSNPSAADVEKSLVLQSLLKGDQESQSSTISVLWNMTDNVKYVQNLMNWLLDQIESAKNILNWTAPSKTFPIYLAIVAAWLVTVVVPGRLLILGWGLYQFFFICLPIPEGRNTMIRISNLLQSIPNDDDIAQIYSAEKKAFAAAKQSEWKQTERARKLELVLPTQWKGLVSIKGSSSTSITATPSGMGAGDEWASVFMLLQGHRLVWWTSEEALDQGKVAAGQLLVCGHAGITQVSPMDIRKFGGDGRLMAVFGQDYVGRPQKLSILFQDTDSKASLFRLLESKC